MFSGFEHVSREGGSPGAGSLTFASASSWGVIRWPKTRAEDRHRGGACGSQRDFRREHGWNSSQEIVKKLLICPGIWTFANGRATYLTSSGDVCIRAIVMREENLISDGTIYVVLVNSSFSHSG